jgi:hypothetical protein
MYISATLNATRLKMNTARVDGLIGPRGQLDIGELINIFYE